jgi:hypothetical protein
MGASVVLAWMQPYVFIRVSEWLGGDSYMTAVNPLLPAFMSLMLFQTATGHAAQLGSRWRRRLLLDAPLLVMSALLLILYARDYPPSE